MAVALALLAHTRRLARTEHRLELLLDKRFDRFADPRPHRHLNAVGTERRNLFLVAWFPGTVLHRVILRHPPPSGRSSWVELRRMMTRFILFHQTQDTGGSGAVNARK
jgi:hypothetical protein